MPTRMVLANWNACSLRSKTLELGDFLARESVDVATITETHLKANENIFLPEYHLLRLDRATAGGGVAIAVKRNIKFRLLPSFKLKLIEAIGVEITSETEPITIIAVYYRKQANIKDGSASDFHNDIIKLTRRQAKFIIAGDLNTRHQAWGNLRKNRNGTILNDDLQAGWYNILSPDQPTYISSTGTHSIIDLFITNISNTTQPVVFSELSSNHFPVVVEVGASCEVRPEPTRRDYHRVEWAAFRRCVDDNISFEEHLQTVEDVDTALGNINTAISVARQQHVREVPCRVSNFLQIDLITKNIATQRNILRRQHQRTDCPELKLYCNQLSREIKMRVVDLRNRDFARKIEQLPTHSKPFWRLAKVLKTKPKPIPPLISPDSPEDRLLTSAEKVRALGQHFASSHNLGQTIISPLDTTVAEGIARLHLSPIELLDEQKITPAELEAFIKPTKNMKAPGFDKTFNLELKHLSSRFYSHLANVFNKCWELGYFPSCWKLAKVIPILKPGKDPALSTSYRPISLLSALSKLFERCIHVRILEFTDENNILLDEQFGFRKGRSTVHQLSRVTNIIKRNKAVSKTSAMALLDVEKVFDDVWHDGLVYKLHQYNFPIFLVKIIQNYLSDRSFQVSLYDSKSDAINIPARVPQGSVLGPIPFNIFTADMPPLPGGGKLSLFADDTAIIY